MAGPMEPLGEVVAVALGSVDKVDTQGPGSGQQVVDLVGGEALAPLTAELPSPHADDRDPQSRGPEPAILRYLPFDRPRVLCEASHT